MQRNLMGSVLIAVATMLNMFGGATGAIPSSHFLWLSILLFICSALTVYWTRADRKLSPFYKGKE